MEASTAVRSSPYACTTPRPAFPAAARCPNCISFNLRGGRSPNLSNSSPGRLAFVTPRHRSLIIKAATEPSPIAPLKLESPTGQFLSQILVNYPHLLPVAVDHQLHQLQASCNTEKSKGKDEPASPATDLVLYRRITEVRANEWRRVLEEILYAMVVQKFVKAEVSLIPALSQPADSSQRVDQWPSEEEKLEQLHSAEAFEMIKNHLTLSLGHRLADSNFVALISKLRVGQVYAVSVMYGYFLKRVDQGFQLEKSMKTLPWGSDEEESVIRQAVTDEPQLSDELSAPPEWTLSAATIGSAVDDHRIRQSQLRSYVMSFDKETLHRYASIRSKEAFSIFEKHSEALFGRPEIMINPGGGIDSSKDEIIKISFVGLKRLSTQEKGKNKLVLEIEYLRKSNNEVVVDLTGEVGGMMNNRIRFSAEEKGKSKLVIEKDRWSLGRKEVELDDDRMLAEEVTSIGLMDGLHVNMEFNQIFITLLDGSTRYLQFPSPTVSGDVLKCHLSSLTGIPASVQRLVTGSLNVLDDTHLSASVGFFPSCTLLLRLRAGMGGFCGTSQKKTYNVDDCQDLSGRHIRQVNAEKMMEEWKAEAKDRKLEKLEEQFLKKRTKGVKKNSQVVVGTEEGRVEDAGDEKLVVLDDRSKEVGGHHGLLVNRLGKSLMCMGARKLAISSESGPHPPPSLSEVVALHGRLHHKRSGRLRRCQSPARRVAARLYSRRDFVTLPPLPRRSRLPLV